MSQRSRWLATGLWLVVTCALPAEVTLIRAGRLVHPDTGQIAANQQILVENGKIREVGAGVAVPAGAKVIDLGERTVLPGRMDCHTHLCVPPLRVTKALAAGLPAPVRWEAQGWPSFFLTTLLNPTGYRAIVGAAHARQMLEAGFTTVRADFRRRRGGRWSGTWGGPFAAGPPWPSAPTRCFDSKDTTTAGSP